MRVHRLELTKFKELFGGPEIGGGPRSDELNEFLRSLEAVSDGWVEIAVDGLNANYSLLTEIA